MEKEIERKYRVKKLPDDLDNYEHITIEQSYLNKGGAPIRLRKFINQQNITTYIFSKKSRISENSLECIEHNIELPENLYNEFLKAKEGKTINKTRYKIPLLDGLHIDLDIFHGFFEGVCIAEIEFNSMEQATSYNIPNWISSEITDFEKLTNGYMATKAISIEEYKDYIL